MLNFDKTDLKENTLMIQNDDGTTAFIPEEGSTEEEKELFAIFRKTFPKGKEWYKIVDGVVIELTQSEYDTLHPVPVKVPTEVEVLQKQLDEANEELTATHDKLIETKTQLNNVSDDFNNFMALAFEKIPSLS